MDGRTTTKARCEFTPPRGALGHRVDGARFAAAECAADAAGRGGRHDGENHNSGHRRPRGRRVCGADNGVSAALRLLRLRNYYYKGGVIVTAISDMESAAARIKAEDSTRSVGCVWGEVYQMAQRGRGPLAARLAALATFLRSGAA